jgi:hypothetical protein
MDARLKVPRTPTRLTEGRREAGKHVEDEDDRERARQRSGEDD